MCGISVVVNGSLSELHLMSHAIKHRGIRHSVFELDNIKVAFNYLPITDKQAAPPPFVSRDCYVWLNGFISNYIELAEKYEIPLETNCDTELLAKFLERFGDSKVEELNGVFAIVCYCANRGELFIVTDRYGARQLYRYTKGTVTYISSEVKGILSVRNIPFSEDGINDWKHSLGVMNDHTIYEGIERVKCLPFIFPKTQHISYDNAKEKLKQLFDKAIARNKVKGLKDCVFLSGGIDSAIIAKNINPNYCFSVDYVSREYSEEENIKLNSVGKHISLMCNIDLYKEYSRKVMYALDDLKAGSCYTNFALTELASSFCTVIYSGAGGDEFFGGYPHRLNKGINQVIKRTSYEGNKYHCSHFEYDLKFLRAVLVVEDRMSGYHTMETRYPLLDNDLVDFALSLPDEYLIDKIILKDISGLHEKVLNSPKRGFSNPYMTNEEWINFTLNKINYVRHSEHIRVV